MHQLVNVKRIFFLNSVILKMYVDYTRDGSSWWQLKKTQIVLDICSKEVT